MKLLLCVYLCAVWPAAADGRRVALDPLATHVQGTRAHASPWPQGRVFQSASGGRHPYTDFSIKNCSCQLCTEAHTDYFPFTASPSISGVFYSQTMTSVAARPHSACPQTALKTGCSYAATPSPGRRHEAFTSSNGQARGHLSSCRSVSFHGALWNRDSKRGPHLACYPHLCASAWSHARPRVHVATGLWGRCVLHACAGGVPPARPSPPRTGTPSSSRD